MPVFYCPALLGLHPHAFCSLQGVQAMHLYLSHGYVSELW